jgi:hypothetical protein
MKHQNLLEDIYRGNISDEEGAEIISTILRSPEAASIKSLLGFSNVEWTAHAQGASLGEIASWRYLGWSQVCSICGAPLHVSDFGWFVMEFDGVCELKHITCPASSGNSIHKAA